MSHQIAIELESIVRRALKTGWKGFGHVANADHIELPGGAFVAIVASLAPYYKEADDETRGEISEFIDRWRDLAQTRVKDNVEEVKKLVIELKRMIDKLEAS